MHQRQNEKQIKRHKTVDKNAAKKDECGHEKTKLHLNKLCVKLTLLFPFSPQIGAAGESDVEKRVGQKRREERSESGCDGHSLKSLAFQ